MRSLKNFGASEWLQLLPLQHALKQVRNDAWMAAYGRRRVDGLQDFLHETRACEGRNVLISVAFEQPWALSWQLRQARRFVEDATVIVLDNSRDHNARRAIEAVCREQRVPYLPLPANRTRHANRSHGMAMSWIYRNVVTPMKPGLFGFIDHDLIPIAPINVSERLGRQSFFGMPVYSEWAWQLWAGYCIFDRQALEGLPLNFLYDFSQGLDTGGRNWKSLYSRFDKSRLRFATSELTPVHDPVTGKPAKLQIVDERWLHIGGISYDDNFKSKSEICHHMAQVFDEGLSWPQLRARGEAASQRRSPAPA